MKITNRKKKLIIFILIAGFLYSLLIFIAQKDSQTKLCDIDTQLLALCIDKEEKGAPYYAIYSICTVYDVLPDKAAKMLLIGREKNSFYDADWPKEKDIEETFKNIETTAFEDLKDYNRAYEAADFCTSLKKLDSVISGFFPIDKSVKFSYEDTFGAKRTYGGDRTHEGLDIICDKGTKVYSVCGGVVIKTGWNNLGGFRILIRDKFGLEYYYAHLSKYAAGLKVGDNVKRGQFIAYSGDTGYGKIGTSGKFIAHLHFGIYENGEAVNPYFFIKQCQKNVK